MDIFYQSAPADAYSRLLKSITDELLSPQKEERCLCAAATKLYSLFSSVTGIGDDSIRPDDLGETRLPNGRALSPRDAARCVLDYSRTSKFLRGINAAILEARKRFPDTTIEILYAGCGPFATLAIPLTTRFSSAEIQFTLLDIHKRSLDAAQHIFRVFGVADFVRNYIHCDATSYRHNAPQPIHIVLTEAMQASLEKEPQVAITMNLAPQICPGGIFIPEMIAIDVCLCDLTKEFTRTAAEAGNASSLADTARGGCRIHLGRILELTAESCRNLLAAERSDGHGILAHSPNPILDVPTTIGERLDLILLTVITIFDSIKLDDYESGLTHPRVLYDLGRMSKGARIEFEYCVRDEPGFRCRFL